MKNVSDHVSRPAHSLSRGKSVKVSVWRPVCVMQVTSSVLVYVSQLIPAVAPIRVDTTSPVSASGPMMIVGNFVSATRPRAW